MEERFIYNIGGLSLEYFNTLIKENIWKAFAVIHTGIHHQMKIILTYYKHKVKTLVNNHEISWKFIDKKTFSQCIDDLYISEAIGDKLREELKRFNTDRNNKLAHLDPYKKREITNEELKKVCEGGVEVARQLDKVIHDCFFP